MFRSLLVEHPLLIQLVRRLVWGVYGSKGLQQSFRVAEDLTYADAHSSAAGSWLSVCGRPVCCI